MNENKEKLTQVLIKLVFVFMQMENDIMLIQNLLKKISIQYFVGKWLHIIIFQMNTGNKSSNS